MKAIYANPGDANELTLDPSVLLAFEQIRKWHARVAAWHFSYSVALVVLAVFSTSEPLPVFFFQLDAWDAIRTGASVTVTVHKVMDLHIKVIPAIFSAMPVVTHSICYYAWERWGYLVKTIQGTAWYCWLEYTLSAPLMNVMIAGLCGCLDFVELCFVFVCTALTMAGGPLVEFALKEGRKKLAWFFFFLGCVPFLVAWAVILGYFVKNAAGAPAFVWAIVFVLFFLESLFGLNTAVFIARERNPSSTLFYEKTKILLSATAKPMLSFLNEGGTRQLSS